MGTHLTVIWALLISFAILMAVKEIFQLLQSPLSYLVSSENWGQWALIGSVALTAWRTPEFQLSYWQYPTAAVRHFFAPTHINHIRLSSQIFSVKCAIMLSLMFIFGGFHIYLMVSLNASHGGKESTEQMLFINITQRMKKHMHLIVMIIN